MTINRLFLRLFKQKTACNHWRSRRTSWAEVLRHCRSSPSCSAAALICVNGHQAFRGTDAARTVWLLVHPVASRGSFDCTCWHCTLEINDELRETRLILVSCSIREFIFSLNIALTGRSAEKKAGVVVVFLSEWWRIVALAPYVLWWSCRLISSKLEKRRFLSCFHNDCFNLWVCGLYQVPSLLTFIIFSIN